MTNCERCPSELSHGRDKQMGISDRLPWQPLQLPTHLVLYNKESDGGAQQGLKGLEQHAM